jgi:Tfp pilus assembly protein PilN
MRRMNLLPPELRPRESSRTGSSYVVVGVLAACALALLAYGLVITGVRSDESELASLKAETQDAQARADALSPYREFAAMKDRREQSVRLVADSRFDYERLTRELMRILPGGVWIGHLEVAPAQPTSDVVEAGADSAVAEGTTLPPAMKVSGCAPSQDVVADALDRLRALTGATDVTLGSSSREGADGGSSDSRVVSGVGANGGCGRDGRPRVAFDATVTLTAPGVEEGGSVPTAAPEAAPPEEGTGS